MVVRRRLDADEARSTGKVWTDVIGIVLAVDDAGIQLRTDPPRGEQREVFVPAADVAAVKRIPPRPSPGGGRPAAR